MGGGAASRALAMAPPEERQQQVQIRLQEMVEELLGRDVDPEEPLMEAGLDSMASVELQSGIQQAMGVELPATLMFDYPSLQAVSGFVSERLEVAPADVGGGPEGADVFGEASAGVSTPVWEESWAAPAPTAWAPTGAARAGGWVGASVGTFSSRGPGLEADLPSCVGRDCVSVYRRDDAESLGWQAGAQGSYFGGLMWAVEGFDPAGLRLGKTEATLMDPQHRLLMQAAAEVLLLESGAGRAPSARTAGLQGMYVGISSTDYARLLGKYWLDASPYAATGNALSVAAGRLSFAFDWRGPSLSVDTACSSSLVGTHLSCQGLRQQDCAAALVAGTNLTLTPDTCMVFKQAGMLAADGRCKTLDSSADGYGRGEACGAVSLRSAEEGADGTASATAAAVVGSGVNQDGR